MVSVKERGCRFLKELLGEESLVLMYVDFIYFLCLRGKTFELLFFYLVRKINTKFSRAVAHTVPLFSDCSEKGKRVSYNHKSSFFTLMIYCETTSATHLAVKKLYLWSQNYNEVTLGSMFSNLFFLIVLVFWCIILSFFKAGSYNTIIKTVCECCFKFDHMFPSSFL